MPIYEYECGACQHHFEKKQKFNDEPVAECPMCQGKSRRIIVGCPIIFKGSGFYVTDCRKGSDSPKNPAQDPPKKEPAAKNESPAPASK